jgi:hypothetical protein
MSVDSLGALETLAPEKIGVVIEPRREMRKMLHRWYETLEGAPFHRSFYNEHFPAEDRVFMRTMECPECDAKAPFGRAEYRFGILENNIDEYYAIECRKCGYSFSWEPNFDSGNNVRIKCGRDRNVVVFGAYVGKHLAAPVRRAAEEGQTQLDEEAFAAYAEKAQVFVISAPPGLLSKAKFMDFVRRRRSAKSRTSNSYSMRSCVQRRVRTQRLARMVC